MLRLLSTPFINMLQNVLMTSGAGLVVKGVLSGDQLTAIVSGLITALVVVLNIATHQQALEAVPPQVTPIKPVFKTASYGADQAPNTGA